MDSWSPGLSQKWQINKSLVFIKLLSRYHRHLQSSQDVQSHLNSTKKVYLYYISIEPLRTEVSDSSLQSASQNVSRSNLHSLCKADNQESTWKKTIGGKLHHWHGDMWLNTVFRNWSKLYIKDENCLTSVQRLKLKYNNCY